MQKNLQLCYSVILNVELHSSLILKTKILFYSFSLSSVSWLSHSLNSVSHVSLSFKFLLPPLLSLSDFSLGPPLATIAQQCQAQAVSRCFAPMWLQCFARMSLLRCGYGLLRWWCMLFASMGSIWLQWVCSNVDVVCSDCDECCLLQWVVG